MAEHLLSEGYAQPAAVVAGCVLEEHVRQLAQAAGLAVEGEEGKPSKLEHLNADLAKAQVYGKTEQKQVTAWYGQRNDAAHGDWDGLTKRSTDACRHPRVPDPPPSLIRLVASWGAGHL